MPSVGTILRQERERQGLDLAAIAQRTRIKLQYLEALERDDFDSLPGRFFARSFTTQYADYLEVNTPELQAALTQQITPPEIFSGAADAAPPIQIGRDFYVDPLPEGSASAISARKLTASVVMLAAVVVACGTIFWLWQRSQISSTLAGTGDTPAASSNQPTSVPEAVSPPAAQPAIPQPVPTPAPVATSLPSDTPTPAPSEAALSGKIRLSVTAKENTWLRITVDGKVKVERVLGPGQSTSAAGDENARVLLGNAGGVEIFFNGASIGEVGPRGQVRTVDFTPERFNVVEPVKRDPSPESSVGQPIAEAGN